MAHLAVDSSGMLGLQGSQGVALSPRSAATVDVAALLKQVRDTAGGRWWVSRGPG